MTSDASPAAPNPALDAALAYAARGWRVVPIIPGQKRPPLGQWTEVATSDATKITAWWGDRYADHGVGIVCGWTADRSSCLFVLDVDEGHQDGVSGGDTLAELEATHGALPATMEVVTGNGGRHLYFTADVEIRNDAGRRLGPGLDVRGEGGQVLAPPTFHPNGTRYEYEASSPTEPAAAPPWLLDLLTADDTPQTPTTPVVRLDDAGDRPGDRWAAQTTWAQLLEADGWTLHHVDRDGEEHWTRPGKERRDGTSATVGYKGSDVLKVFTSSVPELAPEATYTKLGYLAATRHHGDHSAAARALAADGWGSTPGGLDALLPPPGPASADGDEAPGVDGWPVAGPDDIAAVLSGSWEPPTPTILRRSDGAALLYEGKVHSLSGEPGAAKTWIALHAVAEVLADGGYAALIDHEDRLDTAVRRLAGMGVDRRALLERFHYVTPTLAVKGGGIPANVAALAGRCRLVVIDSLGEALAHSQLNQNDDGEVANYLQRAARRLADGGAAVLLLDHVVKDRESQGRWAIGSQRKLAAIDGAAYVAQALVALTTERAGKVKVTVAKDRGGNYGQGSTVAMIELTPVESGVHIVINADDSHDASGQFRPTHLMERVSRWLEDQAEPATGREVERTVDGRGVHLREALRALVSEGYVAVEEGPRGAKLHRSARPFRDDPEPVDNLIPATASHRVPPRPDRVRDAVEVRDDRVPKTPPLPYGEGASGTRSGSGVPKHSEEPHRVPRPEPII